LRDAARTGAGRQPGREGIVSDKAVNQIAVEMYSVRHLTNTDMLGALEYVAGVGYRAVEFAGYGTSNPSEIRKKLDDLGVRAVSAHVGFNRFEQEIDQLVEDMHILGCTHAVVPWLAEDWRGPARVPELADRFNTWGARCKAEGMRFGYHNHDFELVPVDGKLPLDKLIDATDPSLVDFQIDFYFTQAAGIDGAALVRRLAGRVSTLHIKDLAPGPGIKDAPVGSGVIDWDPILAAARESGTNWYIVEQETNPPDLAGSLRFLQSKLGGA
jgi:sugar phosphate isomerase/epimerase